MKKHTLQRILLIVFMMLTVMSTNAQKNLRVKHFNTERGVAIQGYDPVAYFTTSKAVKGDKQYAVSAEGVVYYCSSEENKNLFLKDYKKYEPQFGGWCAYAMGNTGEKVAIDPETFKITNGKLYLFYHTWTNNTLPKWNKDEQNLKAKAELNWKHFLNN